VRKAVAEQAKIAQFPHPVLDRRSAGARDVNEENVAVTNPDKRHEVSNREIAGTLNQPPRWPPYRPPASAMAMSAMAARFAHKGVNRHERTENESRPNR
jgi:hypothetical protein